MKKLVTLFILLVLGTMSFGQGLLAAQDQFIIGQTVIASPDTIAPSIPTGLTATAVSQTQIDLSWTASTDNSAVTGYQVFRGLTQIATSTATTYSDAGLNPSTLYSYTVTAFDASLNISDHSATATATTFDPTPIATTTPNTGGPGAGGSYIVLKYLSVSPDLESALIRFGVNVPVQAQVFWGKTQDYELGGISSALYQKDHSVELIGLTPETHYYFKIVLLDGFGRQMTVGNQEFTTLSPADIFAPANVTNFRATPSNSDITLTWQNPKADFEKVRIVKSTKFYPRDPTEGEVIYEGRAERFVDSKVVLGKRYYYSAFAQDRAGNYSSGAVTDAELLKNGEAPSSPKLFAGILQLPKDMIDALLRSFSIADIDFIQDGKKLPKISDTVDIRGDRNLTISIDYEKVPEILKTIAVTMYDPEDSSKTFSFLLRINADKTAYQAHIAAFERPGKYQFALAILDYKNQGLASLAGTLVASVPNLVFGNKPTFGDFTFTFSHLLWVLLILLILAVLMYLTMRRKRKTVPVQTQL